MGVLSAETIGGWHEEAYTFCVYVKGSCDYFCRYLELRFY